MAINKLLEVEEHIWSPMYGLKGNVDATVQVVMQNGCETQTLTVPFEVKTGKRDNNESHRAQTALYTLLLSDRYGKFISMHNPDSADGDTDVEVMYGILYYLETSKTIRIQGIRNEIRHMIIQRNELAGYVKDRLELPPMIKRSHLCNRCYAKTTCFVYHKLVDNGDGETSGVAEKFDEVVDHLTPAHQEFFKKWDDLLTKEEKEMMKFRRELWTMVSSEREKLGRCFSNVVLSPESAHEQKSGSKINRFHYTFTKHDAAPDFSFTESQLTVGEPIVISDEKGHFALSNGYVTLIRPRRIEVAVDRRLKNVRVRSSDFDPVNNQSFTGIMAVVNDETGTQSKITPEECSDSVLYRLDKDEFSNGMATVRNNLIRMMEKDLYRARELRSLIIDGTAPSFKPTPSAYALSGPASQAELNVDQRRAIEKVMSAQDYALVLGMPGTGKTTTIAHIIRALVAQGKSVLLTSYTHTAVDNILLKIRNDGIRVLRIGAVAKVHPEVRDWADLASVPKATIEALKDSYEKPSVVATTCLGINHPIFNERIFDYCIVDEASQITLPVCLGPVRMAKTFILVGDHYQLPPLVQNKEAQKGGLDVSLFKLLSDRQPDSVVNLEHQYRMCADIMLLSNKLIYSGRLKCGTEAVANRLLEIPDPAGLAKLHRKREGSHVACTETSNKCWISSLMNISPANPVRVRFLNTDPLLPASRDNATGSRIINTVEATLTAQLVASLIAMGIDERKIGVITLYRSQLALLKDLLRKHTPALEMHTADKFQGRDKEIIILSCVRSNEAGNVGDLLRDWRRVNVALTRARSLMFVIGSRGTLSKGGDVLGGFVNLMDEKSWRVDLPVDAVEAHAEAVDEALGVGAGSLTQFPFQSPIRNAKEDPDASVVVSPAKQRLLLAKEEQRIRSLQQSPTKHLGNGVGAPKRRLGPHPHQVPKKLGGKGGVLESLANARPVLRDVFNDSFGGV